MSSENINTEIVSEEVVQQTPKKATRKSTRAKKTEPKVNAVPDEVKKPIVPKDIDPGQYVTVKNGFHGVLVYKSPRTGEITKWDGFGSEQEMELRELRSARNTSKSFFENNWFMFDEPWIITYLGVDRYYKHTLSIDRFDELFSMDASELKKVVDDMSAGQKRSVAYRASTLISEGKIDSLKTISALEESLGIELIEH